MKFLVLALCVCVASAAVPRWQQAGKAAAKVAAAPFVATANAAASVASAASDAFPILKSESIANPDGGYSYSFETGNGILASSSGTLKKVDQIDTVAVQGSYQYVAPDGTPVRVEYIADENGYQPKSDLLPVGPAIPDYIARSVEYILAHPHKE